MRLHTMSPSASINHNFYKSLETHLSAERLMVYGQDGVDELTVLARYHLNLALSEALYPTLQTAEVALRNAIHYLLIRRVNSTDWYDCITLPSWQSRQVFNAKAKLREANKPLTPDRVVAELTFGFWVRFFTSAHVNSGIAYSLSKKCFPNAKKSERAFNIISPKWQKIRKLRNRIFHHERILHWADLDQQHEDILDLIYWMNPSLHKTTSIINRFPKLRVDGLRPWMEQLNTF